jgi:tetratricopeptide (TPR) repeat protein
MDDSVVNHLNELSALVNESVNEERSVQQHAWIKLANAFHSYELYQVAELAYKNALLFDGNNQKIKYQLAHLYRLQSAFDTSNQLLEQLAKDNANYAPIYNNWAENLFDQGRLPEAKKAILSSFSIKKDEPYALQIYANVLSQSGEIELAIAALEKSLSLQPEATKLYFSLAQLYQQLGLQDKAEAARLKSGNGTIKTTDLWLSEVTADVRGYNQFMAKAEHYLNADDYQNAMYWAQKAAADRPNGFNTQMVFGLINAKTGKIDESIEHFRKAYLKRPNDFKVNLNLATVYKNKGEYQRSLEFYRKAMNIDPNHDVLKINYADAACLVNQVDVAMPLINELKSSSINQQAYYLGLKCLVQNKKYSEAYQWVQDHISLTINNISFIEYAVLLLTSTPFDEQRNASLALSWLEKLMQNQATNKQLQLLVLVLIELNQFERAEQILATIPEDPDLYFKNSLLKQSLTQKVKYRMSL